MHKYLVLVTLQVVLVSSATWYKKVPQTPPGTPPGCYIREVGGVIPFGQEVTIEGCVRVECTPRYIYYSSCGVERTADPSCVISPGPFAANYPDCCPVTSCNDLEHNRI